MKTDARDARSLARAVYWGSYSEVMPLSEEDEAYRDYIRMRDDRNDELKRAKQHLLSFLLRRGKQYQGKNYWTRMHMKWLRGIGFGNPVDQLTFREYLNEVTRLMDAIELLDARIEEFSRNERYAEDVSKLRCFAGIDTHCAMVMVTEIGDYGRFPSAETFASYLGLTPQDRDHESGKHSLQEDAVRECERNRKKQPIQEVETSSFKADRHGSGCDSICGQGITENKEEVFCSQGEWQAFQCRKGRLRT